MNDVVTRTELLLPGPAQALGGLLDVPVPDLDTDGLPLLWHWIYLLDRPRQADLGPDGHPVGGALPAPPGPARRRMWAGGRVRTSARLRCGQTATRRSRVLSIQNKPGRSGPLTFVTVGHEIVQHGCVIVEEQQDIVYRQATVQAPWPPSDGQASPAADDEWAIEVSPTLLFASRHSPTTPTAFTTTATMPATSKATPDCSPTDRFRLSPWPKPPVAPDTAVDEMAAWSSGTGWSPRCSTTRA